MLEIPIYSITERENGNNQKDGGEEDNEEG
jgi:hypothetical protein